VINHNKGRVPSLAPSSDDQEKVEGLFPIIRVWFLEKGTPSAHGIMSALDKTR
jgi:hypothetical protein